MFSDQILHPKDNSPHLLSLQEFYDPRVFGLGVGGFSRADTCTPPAYRLNSNWPFLPSSVPHLSITYSSKKVVILYCYPIMNPPSDLLSGVKRSLGSGVPPVLSVPILRDVRLCFPYLVSNPVLFFFFPSLPLTLLSPKRCPSSPCQVSLFPLPES